jgi:D-alanyl-D-alanine carboxypeptidase/D-alanyl-D-alanine-endopeptidase (penicillin-binding protein 4)
LRDPARAAADPASARAAFVALADSLLAAPAWDNAHWGVLVVDPEAGDTLYARNPGKLFVPASNQKILTGAAALALLGADFRWRTTLVADGGALGPDGTLRGDLRVVGRGDPTVSDRAAGDAMAPLRALADSLRARGVRRVAGRVLPAGDAFPGDPLGYGWAADDLDEPYAAGVSELLFNEGLARVVVRPGARPGDPVRAVVRPAPSAVRVDAAGVVTATPGVVGGGTSPTNVAARWDAAGGRYVLTGAVSVADSAVLELAVRDPRAAYAAALTEALRERGVAVEGARLANADGGCRGRPQPCAADRPADTLAARRSPTLAEVLPWLEKPSQNQIAEAVFRTVGLERTGVGTPDSARAALGRQLALWGVAPEREAVIRDGSGLSRHDFVTPRALVRVLDAARRRPDFGALYDALPVAGVDGTLRNRMRGTAAAGNVRAKTGTVDKARSLSGYVTAADGRVLVFSMLCNNYTTPTREVERVQDALLARLAGARLR